MNPELKHTRYQYGVDVFGSIVGKTFSEVFRGEYYGGDAIFFVVDDNEAYVMYYEPDCCAGCDIEDITGDLNDLIGEPIILAREDTNSDDPPSPNHYVDSYTWTFYNIATRKGHVTIRWYGSSNGYYSETASFAQLSTTSRYS